MKNFVVGLGIGLGIGALVAPRPGEETRELLRTRAQALRNSLQERAGNRTEEVQTGSVLEALNTISRDRLMTIYGIGPLTADKIIKHRPYDSEETFIAQRIVPESIFESLHAALLKMTA
ncbi:MAG TPA: YtxH domain-containing protein [Terriglobales bacterium]|nr:YtxH domain-containing protein [Terriglobales bacterium]